MKSGLILENNDVKKIIAEHFNVDESCVVKSQYTWTVVTGETDSKKEEWYKEDERIQVNKGERGVFNEKKTNIFIWKTCKGICFKMQMLWLMLCRIILYWATKKRKQTTMQR